MTYDTQNIFAKILRGELPCDEIYQNDYVLAFKDITPAAPTHILVIPKGEYISFHDFTTNAPPKTITEFYNAIQHITNILNISENGYRLITNHGPEANQTVPHFHVHILAGKNLGGLLPTANQ